MAGDLLYLLVGFVLVMVFVVPVIAFIIFIVRAAKGKGKGGNGCAGLLAAVMLAVMTLAACGGGEDARRATSTRAAPPTTMSQAEGRALAFDLMMADHPEFSGTPSWALREAANDVCRTFDDGATWEEVVHDAVLTEPYISMQAHAEFIGGAIGAFCPEYVDLLP